KALPQLKEPVFLLTTGANNSLAASMEILSYLRQKGVRAEILHGSEEKIAQRLKTLGTVFKAVEKIHSLKIGVVGKPSDWLISSEVYPLVCKAETGIEIIDIPMEEFLEEIAKKEYIPNQYTEDLKAKNFHPEDTEKCLEIYGALKRICGKYELDGVTVRCFDLLDTVHGTGCLALAILNAEGVYAGCEGDVPSLISMCVAGEVTGEPVFMANPSRIELDKNQIVFAHCTLPINMPKDYTCMTHYESGIGVGLRGTLKEGPVTVFKTSGLLDKHYVKKGELIKNLTEPTLCRTQIRLQMEEGFEEYYLKNSIGNHHMIVLGDHVKALEEFFEWFRKKED
ncbi:MAG: hypothetical protein IIY44_00680, partial [Erysipelotrichales bacterium]|nr:hypothetical protein [Erysipelotrichales bacterium]